MRRMRSSRDAMHAQASGSDDSSCVSGSSASSTLSTLHVRTKAILKERGRCDCTYEHIHFDISRALLRDREKESGGRRGQVGGKADGGAHGHCIVIANSCQQL